MSDRVVVFLDYQNVYNVARESFHQRWDPSQCGQVDPVRLGELLAARRVSESHLHQVRVYRGRPDATHDQRGYAACTRQSAIWGQDPRVHVELRTLTYPPGWPDRHEAGRRPQEKGIDVALAVDFATMATRNEYDVGILFSVDTDLKPALEVVTTSRQANAGAGPRAEVAAWSAPQGHSRRLSITQGKLWCHWVGQDDYDKVADPTRYTS